MIAMLAVGNGAQASITGSINQVGTNLLFVFSGARDNRDINTRPPRPVTIGDANALMMSGQRLCCGDRGTRIDASSRHSDYRSATTSVLSAGSALAVTTGAALRYTVVAR